MFPKLPQSTKVMRGFKGSVPY